MTKRLIMIGSISAVALLTWGCAPTHKPIDPGTINHVVLFTLKDASMSPELQRDCETHLRDIPSLRTYACGPHVEMGRTIVTKDYTLGMIVSFDDEAGYEAYLEHPGHVTLVEKWKPHFSSITIYDIGNEETKE
jgi:hypothetical protein